MNKEDNHNLSELFAYLKEEIPKINNNIESINRAIYGDKINKVKGLIDYNKDAQKNMEQLEENFSLQIEEIKDRISTIEKLKNKVGWIVSGLVTGASVGGASLWEWLSKMK